VLTFEIRFGISCRAAPPAAAQLMSRLTDRFEDRSLGIERGIAELWGVIMARAAAMSLRLPVMDTLLAATAEYHGMTMVTRNVRDFARADVATLDPWSAA
jgi:predicted nucleic acid-binding protein